MPRTNSVQGILTGEQTSQIRESMHLNCKIAVMVPVYNESAGLFLSCLESLAAQTKIKPEEFEVAVVINNSKREALEKEPAFLANSAIFEIIRFIQGGKEPKSADKTVIRRAGALRDKHLAVRVIDKFSAATAYEENNVGTASNRACAELANRFLTSTKAGQNGIIALADCDCILSPNFLQALTVDFVDPTVNACSGILQYAMPNSVKKTQILQKALETYLHRPLMIRNQPKKLMRRNDSKTNRIISCCPNLAVRVRSYIAVGGMGKHISNAGTALAIKLSSLPGLTCVDMNYSVFVLARPSARADLFSFGRAVEFISRSVEAYMIGKANKVLLPKTEDVRVFLGVAAGLAKNGKINEDNLRRLCEELQMPAERLSAANFKELALAVEDDMSQPLGIRPPLWRTMAVVAEKFYDSFPKTDITSLVATQI